ncbi:MAG: C2H2-type zinc finger protein [Candidatus Bathyarchaeota archaeon]
MAAGEQKIKGVVDEVGLVRDEDKFNAFNVTINMVVKGEKPLTYNEGEQMIKQYRKNLLGKEVVIASIIHPCPLCDRVFDTEFGMKQHIRMIHNKKKKPSKTKKSSKKSSKK